MPQIAVGNESTVISDADVQKMLPAFDHQWNKDLEPVWGVDTAAFVFTPKGQHPAVIVVPENHRDRNTGVESGAHLFK